MNQTRIVCVDDERNVLRSLERIFMDDDYEILSAGSGEEGLRLLAETPQVQVVISDYRMPGMNGVEFLREVFSRHPDTIRIVLSGYADTASVVAAINEGKIYKFIPKPWNDDELRMTVATALEHFASRRKNVQLTEELRLRNEELRELNANLEALVQERTRELQQQNRELWHARNVLEQLPYGVLGVSGGILVQANHEASLLLGLDRAAALGRPAEEALPQELVGLLGCISACSCGYQTLSVAGCELTVKGLAMREDAPAGIVLTLMRKGIC
ncbi:hypothetical protein GMLC_35740 [Geomonas limicola]|uniref:Response regulatory domain-containing protein n=1 Tax=Geomonas limicola TaxID=2740186 RepID=A0A6V8NBK2_9BACT|nr:response regulator [Geomonas limicola]GFO69995.1 hypothetical protein GMLC_35740 [Geomonas limicola]